MIKIRYYAPLVAGVVFILSLFFQAWQTNSLLQKREWQYSENLLRDALSRAQGNINRYLRRDDISSVRQIMADLYLYKRDTMAFLLSDQVILASNRLGYESRKIDHIPFPVDEKIIKNVKTSQQGIVLRNMDDESLTGYFPVTTDEADRDDNYISHNYNAVLIVHVELDDVFQRRQKEIFTALTRSAVIIILITLILSVILHFVFTKRIEALLVAVKKYADGDFQTRIKISGNDEITDISKAFNDLAEAVAENQRGLVASQEEISALNRSLEKRVEERTLQIRSEIKDRLEAQRALEASQV